MDQMLEWQHFSVQLFVSNVARHKHNAHPGHLKLGHIQAGAVPLGTQKNYFPAFTDTWYNCAKFHTASASFSFSHLTPCFCSINAYDLLILVWQSS